MIRDLNEYLAESFSIYNIEKFGLPAKHYEYKGFFVVGDKRSGKTVLTVYDLAKKAWDLWGNDIDFFKAEDIYALIDAVAASDRPVHFILLDDQVSYLDSRNPMGNKTVTELYFEIAHELERRSKLMGGNRGGLVICALLTQSFQAIDLRLRGDEMFTIFKTYDKKGFEEYEIYDPEIEQLLLEYKVRSNRLTDYEVRKWAFVIDRLKEGCLIYFDATDHLDDDSPTYKTLPFEFKTKRGIDRYREQRNKLVDDLVEHYNLFKLSDKDLRSELYEKVDALEDSLERCRITPAHFMEIIYRARKKYRKLNSEEFKKLQNEQKKQLIEYLYTGFNMNDYTDFF